MKRRLVPGAALALAASLALAGSASAASWLDPGEKTYVPTPDGKIDHWVYEYDNDLGGEKIQTRWESWNSSDRSHSISRSLSSGTLLTEDAVEGAKWTVFFADANELRIRTLKVPGRPVTHNLRTTAAILREQVDAGWLKVDGETTVGGRRALVLVDGPNEPVAEYHSERIVVDAGTYVELEAERRSTGFREGGGQIQTVSRRKLVVNETIDLAGNEAALAMGDHPGATIVNGGAIDEFKPKKKAKKAKARKRPAKKAKKRAGRSRRAAR